MFYKNEWIMASDHVGAYLQKNNTSKMLFF